jgi:hypothetical protein
LAAVTPFVLQNGGQTFLLTLGNYDENYAGGRDAGRGGLTGPLNTAELVAVPESTTLGLAALT